MSATDVFTAAYREHAPRVLGYLRMHGVDDPESVTQEVFLSLYSRIESVTGGEEGVRSLIFAIAHARLVDHLRVTARRPTPWPYQPERDGRTTESAEDRVVGAVGASEAWRAVQELGEDQRDVVGLRIVAGLSLAETAQVLGRTEGAIKQLQRRALENLRTRMSERNDDA